MEILLFKKTKNVLMEQRCPKSASLGYSVGICGWLSLETLEGESIFLLKEMVY
jgi:hypothetical protein